jgi:hypothetical protein
MTKRVAVATSMLLLSVGTASACSPAPSCWIDEGPAYLKTICRDTAKNPSLLKHVDEPDQIGRFIKACAKLRIVIKQPGH